jgi:cell division inhibitor SepF
MTVLSFTGTIAGHALNAGRSGVWLGLVEDDGEFETREPARGHAARSDRYSEQDRYGDEFEDDLEYAPELDEYEEPERPRAQLRTPEPRERVAPRQNSRGASVSPIGAARHGRDLRDSQDLPGFATHDNLALAPQVALRDRTSVAESSEPYRITTLHPTTYNEARTIGEHFRSHTPVIMNLTEMDEADAKRLVDFAAGLAFGLRGSIERVTNRVFLLSPASVTVTAEDRARIAEGGFFNQS